jgi:hypothetical protein
MMKREANYIAFIYLLIRYETNRSIKPGEYRIKPYDCQHPLGPVLQPDYPITSPIYLFISEIILLSYLVKLIYLLIDKYILICYNQWHTCIPLIL